LVVEQNGNRVGRMATSTGEVKTYTTPSSNRGFGGITLSPDGNVCFTESATNRLGRINRQGQIAEFALRIADSQPNGIVTGGDGNIWFTQTAGDAIGIVALSGKFGGRLLEPGSILEFRLPVKSSGPTQS
jgi:virginiamycin B lyase